MDVRINEWMNFVPSKVIVEFVADDDDDYGDDELKERGVSVEWVIKTIE